MQLINIRVSHSLVFQSKSEKERGRENGEESKSNADGENIASYTFIKEIFEEPLILAILAPASPRETSVVLRRRMQGCERCGGCASATRVLRVVITRHLQSPLTLTTSDSDLPCNLRGWFRMPRGGEGVGTHSIDFVQDSRRLRRRRGQPDPPLVVPTRIQHYFQPLPHSSYPSPHSFFLV